MNGMLCHLKAIATKPCWYCSLHLYDRVSSASSLATYKLVLNRSGLLMHIYHYAIWLGNTSLQATVCVRINMPYILYIHTYIHTSTLYLC